LGIISKPQIATNLKWFLELAFVLLLLFLISVNRRGNIFLVKWVFIIQVVIEIYENSLHDAYFLLYWYISLPMLFQLQTNLGGFGWLWLGWLKIGTNKLQVLPIFVLFLLRSSVNIYLPVNRHYIYLLYNFAKTLCWIQFVKGLPSRSWSETILWDFLVDDDEHFSVRIRNWACIHKGHGQKCNQD